jgi:hypothetical protein
VESRTEEPCASTVDFRATPFGRDATWGRLENQIAWYDSKSTAAQRAYKQLKLLELLFAATLPALTGLGRSPVLVSVVATSIVVFEGVQHLYQYQERWITYRSTCEALRHERYLYLAGAGPYALAASPGALLAERIEGLISQEHARWTSGHGTSATVKGSVTNSVGKEQCDSPAKAPLT